MSSPILDQLEEPTLGQPGWNVVFNEIRKRANAIPEIAMDALATKIVQGAGINVSFNSVTKVLTISAGGAAALDTEALMDFLAAHILPGANMAASAYDDAAGELTLNCAVTGYTDQQVDDRVIAFIKQTPGIRKLYDSTNHILRLENRALGSVPSDHGLENWTVHPDQATSSTVPTTGVVYLVRFRAYEDDVINTIATRIAANGTSPTNCFVGIYSTAGARLGLSADLASTYGTSGEKSNALTAGVPVVADTDYVFAQLIGGGTPGSQSRGSASNMSNYGIALPNFRLATFGTGLTALPSTIDFSTAVNNTGLVQLFAGFKS